MDALIRRLVLHGGSRVRQLQRHKASCRQRFKCLICLVVLSSIISIIISIPLFDTVDWEEEYMEAKDLCVRVLASCGREELARFLADKHSYFEGTIRLCHEAEMQQVRERGDYSWYI